MELKQIYHDILESWLPTKWSRAIAGITPTLAISSLFLPKFLSSIGIEITPQTAILIRLSVPPTLLFIGTFLILVFVVHHFKNSENYSPEEIKLNDMQEKILKFIFDKKPTPSEIRNEFKLVEEEANYYVESLHDIGFISCPGPYSTGNFYWFIKQPGREYIMNKTT